MQRAETGRVGDVTRRVALPLVAAGGAVGAGARWGILAVVGSSGFPWATLITNLVGCALLGVFLGRRSPPSIRLFFGAGLCGGLTTFSTFAVEVAGLLRENSRGLAVAYLVASVAGGLTAFQTGRVAGTLR